MAKIQVMLEESHPSIKSNMINDLRDELREGIYHGSLIEIEEIYNNDENDADAVIILNDEGYHKYMNSEHEMILEKHRYIEKYLDVDLTTL